MRPLRFTEALFTFLFPAAALAAEDYLVLVDPGKGDQYLPAAEDLAAFHHAPVHRFSPKDLEGLLPRLREARPRFAAFVLPPGEIDVDLCHGILELSTRLDDDPFQDFEYGFVTGRDGEAARRFVAGTIAAFQHEFGRKGAMLALWGGMVPLFQLTTASKAIGLELRPHLVSGNLDPDSRRKAVGAALASFHGLDLLTFFSHGYPDQMVGCFTGRELREWKVDLRQTVLISCACFNGAPGRWWMLGAGGIEGGNV